MPHFHFHLHTRDGLEWDREGLDFTGLEAAYLDVCRAIPAMAADLQHTGTGLSHVLRYAFEIADVEGQLLMEVPFSDVLDRDRRPRRPASASAQQVRTELQRTESLIAAIRQERDALTAALSRMQLRLARLRALDMGGHGCGQP
ncbi:DUF6894 family protein [Methylobacterium nigriterrae]|uniref:DUF6894 family protein n=1 Tax=Methylobacterium nigriterrae TaxID=3127512 RepID=UPI00301351B3